MRQVAETGSISAAGRALGIPYRRAWLFALEAKLNTATKDELAALTQLVAQQAQCKR